MLKASILAFVILSLLWLALSGGAIQEIWFGLIWVLIATATARILWSTANFDLNLWRLLPFLIFMVKESLLGGLYVAKIAFYPSLHTDSGYIKYPCKPHSNELVLVFFVWLVSIPPGTISVALLDDVLIVHVLDKNINNISRIRRLEEYLHALFN
jgi:multicomponent Na+:H+ antiporter subunit E